MFVTLISVLGFAFFPAFPESTFVQISNQLEESSITSVNLILPNAKELINIPLACPILPGSTVRLRFPWGFINRVIFNSSSGNVYYQSGFAASSNPDTLIVSLARKEFGVVFDRIYGTLPIAVRNSTSVNIVSVQVEGESIPPGNILGSNPLMPGEVIRLWVNSSEPYSFVFQDADGFVSDAFTAVTDADSIYRFTNDVFYSNGTLRSTQDPGYSFTVTNCINSEELVLVEAFDESGYQLLCFDLAETPLETWDRLTTQTDFPPSFVVCTDSRGREYSLNEPDSVTGIYEFDLLSLDFNFSFPERD